MKKMRKQEIDEFCEDLRNADNALDCADRHLIARSAKDLRVRVERIRKEIRLLLKLTGTRDERGAL